MQTPVSLLPRLEPLSCVEGFDALERTLRDPATRFHESGSDGRVTVKMIDHAWGTRLKIARDSGRMPVSGSEHLVRSLAALPKAAILNMVVFEGDRALGAVWFAEATDEPVGFVVGDRSSAV